MPDAEKPEDPGEQPAGDPVEDEHQPDGLDLARAQTLGAAASGTTPARRRTPQGPEGRLTPARFRRRSGNAQLSGAWPDGRDPQGIEAEVGRLISERGWGLDLQVRGVFGRWQEIVGTEIGAHSTPESLTDGTLVVRTDSTAWATQLRLFAATVVQRLNDELGPGTVSVVEVLGPHAPSWKHGRRGIRDARGPRDTYG